MIALLQRLLNITDPMHLYDSNMDSLNNLPLHFHWKDRKGHYIDFNDRVLMDCGFDKNTDIKGMTDLDFNFLPEIEALNIRQRDHEIVIKNTPKIYTGPLTLHNNKKAIEVSVKTPLLSKYSKKTIGVITLALIVDQDMETASELQANPFKAFLKAQTFAMNQIEYSSSLYKSISKREKQCLKHYLAGKTAKETAIILKLSYRTVEEYINNLKIKFKCKNKRDLLKLFNIDL